MQTKKEQVKRRIDEAALSLFATKGFQNASMSEIAKRAGISVGNVYLYYETKEELFYSLVPPELVEQGKRHLAEKIRSAFGMSVREAAERPEVRKKHDEFLHYLIRYRLPLLAAFRYGAGTLYESLASDTSAMMLKWVKGYLRALPRSKQGSAPVEEAVLALIYANLLSGTLTLLQDSVSPQDLHQRLEAYLTYHLGGLDRLLF